MELISIKNVKLNRLVNNLRAVSIILAMVVIVIATTNSGSTKDLGKETQEEGIEIAVGQDSLEGGKLEGPTEWAEGHIDVAMAIEDEPKLEVFKQVMSTNQDDNELELMILGENEELNNIEEGEEAIKIKEQQQKDRDKIKEQQQKDRDKIKEQQDRIKSQKQQLSRGVARISPTKSYETVERTVQNALVDIAEPDANYGEYKVDITGGNRRDLEALVMGEAGGEGFIGAAIVAQAIKDTMVMDNNYNVRSIKQMHKYSATLSKEPNQDSVDAVAYIFDEGGYAIKHRVIYFYAPKGVKGNWSKFHESQKPLIQYKNHKFFDRK